MNTYSGSIDALREIANLQRELGQAKAREGRFTRTLREVLQKAGCKPESIDEMIAACVGAVPEPEKERAP